VGWIGWALILLAFAGLAIHFTVKDAVPGLSFLFYALPLPVIAALILLGGLSWFFHGLRLRPLLCTALAVVLLGIWLVDNYRQPPVEVAEGDLRVLLWNVGRGRGGWERISDEIRSAEADIIGLVEASYHYPDPHTYWRRQFPGHSVYAGAGGLVLISKARITDHRRHELGEHSRCATAEVVLDERRVRLVLVDLEANPFLRRARMIEDVVAIAGIFPETPTVILGDFNTPPGSRGFDRLRDSYVNVFERAGRGFLPTWPSAFPILSLDQVWISPHFVPIAAWKKSSLISDHSRLWCDLSWRPGLLHPRLGTLPRRGPALGRPASPPGRPVLGSPPTSATIH
jgi:endonuclease/exonuclease/phosphatase family metal-dependent hydrolase